MTSQEPNSKPDTGAEPTINGVYAESHERSETDVYMLIVRTNDELQQYDSTPVSYDLTGESNGNGAPGARALRADEMPDDADEFIFKACDELENVGLGLVVQAVTNNVPKGEAFVKLLADFQKQPAELIHNILAAFLVNAMDDTAAQMAEDDGSAAGNLPDNVPGVPETPANVEAEPPTPE